MKCAVIVAIEQDQDPAQASAFVSLNTAQSQGQGPFSEIAVKIMRGVEAGGEDFSWVKPGVEAALEDQCDWTLLLDPGSVLAPNVFSEFEDVLRSAPGADAVFGLLCHHDAKDGTPVLDERQPAEIGDYEDFRRHDPESLTGNAHFVRTAQIAANLPQPELGAGAFVRYRQDLWKTGSAIRVPKIFSIGRPRPGAFNALGKPLPSNRHESLHRPWRKAMRRNPIKIEAPVEGLPSQICINDPAKLDQAALFEGRLYRGTLLAGLQELRDRGLLRPRPAVLEIGPGSGAELCWLRHHLDASWIGAIEPDPDLREILMRNLETKGDRCELDVRAPVLAEGTDDEMHILIPGLQHLPANAVPLDGLKRTIPTATVDTLFCCRDVDLLRIDRRHNVQNVLRGAKDLITRSRPILWLEVVERDITSLFSGWAGRNGYQLFTSVRVEAVMNHLLLPLEVLSEEANWDFLESWQPEAAPGCL